METEIKAPEKASALEENKETAFLAEQYQVLSNRRISHNELFWNVPLMFLTAQSFLLILALGGYTQIPWEKAIGAFISFVFGFLSIQVFERNRVMEITDAEQLLDIERQLLAQGYTSLEIHQKQVKRKYLSGGYVNQRLEKRKILNFLNRGVSADLWKKGMWFTTVASIFLFFYNISTYINFESLFGSSLTEYLITIAKPAGSTLALLIAINWFLIILRTIEKSQPDARINTRKRTDKKKFYNICLYSFESIVISFSLVWGYIAYLERVTSINFLWAYAFIVCLISVIVQFLIVYFQRNELKLFRRVSKQQKTRTRGLTVISIILAGGNGTRLQSVIRDNVKFIAISSDKKTLLENAIERNQRISDKQIIITNHEYIERICSLEHIKYRLNNEGKIKRRLRHIKRNSSGGDIYDACETQNIVGFQYVGDIGFLVEPSNKGTATAIYHYIIRSLSVEGEDSDGDDPVIIIAPSDHVISEKDSYIATLKKACELARVFANIYLLGVAPTYPSTQYGYLSVNGTADSVSKVEKFVEKPKLDEARILYRDGRALWNSGIFVARRSVLLTAFQKSNWGALNLFEGCSFIEKEIRQVYDQAADSSFDKDILEKADNLYAIAVSFDWVDVGDPERLQTAILEGLCSI